MSEKDSITPKQRNAIPVILQARTQAEAAGKIGITERQLYRWLLNAKFRAALLDAEGKILDEATRRLLGGQMQALDTLAELMANADAESVRRQAANDWMNHAMKLRELRNLEERVKILEDRQDAKTTN